MLVSEPMRPLVLLICTGCSFDLPATAAGDGNSIDTSGGDTPAEAGTEAAVFDPTQCPAGYANGGITASPESRYRFIDATDPFAIHYADCNDDLVGWTHLVVLETVQEAQQIRATITSTTYYAGAVQERSASGANVGWLELTGRSVQLQLWQTDQPNDNNSGGEQNEQNLAAADDGSGLLNDVSGSSSYRAVCECDGHAVPKPIDDLVTSNLPN
jgi:hypothetical protein